LVLVLKKPGLKAEAFSPALLVSVALIETNGPYKLGLKAFFPPVERNKPLQVYAVEVYDAVKSTRAGGCTRRK
jgi:hypothetical protein